MSRKQTKLGRTVHIQEECDTWLSTDRRKQQTALKKARLQPLRRSLPTPGHIQIEFTSSPLEIRATKQTTLNKFFCKREPPDHVKRNERQPNIGKRKQPLNNKKNPIKILPDISASLSQNDCEELHPAIDSHQSSQDSTGSELPRFDSQKNPEHASQDNIEFHSRKNCTYPTLESADLGMASKIGKTINANKLKFDIESSNRKEESVNSGSETEDESLDSQFTFHTQDEEENEYCYSEFTFHKPKKHKKRSREIYSETDFTFHTQTETLSDSTEEDTDFTFRMQRKKRKVDRFADSDSVDHVISNCFSPLKASSLLTEKIKDQGSFGLESIELQETQFTFHTQT